MKKGNYAIEMLNITKKFGPLYANKNVTLKVKKGEIHALLGENGAGKSTIMSILFGLYSPDEGQIKINGKTVKINDPNDATKLKIGMVHQHFKLVDCYTILQNIVLGSETFNKRHYNNLLNKRDYKKYRLNLLNGAKTLATNFGDFTKLLQTSHDVVELRYNLVNKLHLTTEQVDFILKHTLNELMSPELTKEIDNEIKELEHKLEINKTKQKPILEKSWFQVRKALAKSLDFLEVKLKFVDYRKSAEKVSSISKKYGLNVDMNSKVSDVTVGMQQRTEILKMLYRDADILIFDEPTAVLTPQEIDGLLNIMRNLKREGKTIIFITHKLNEIMAVSDRVSILRRGECIGTANTKNTTISKLSDMMVGHHVSKTINTHNSKKGETLLKVRKLFKYDQKKRKNILNDINFDLHKGEILTIAGIDGNGQKELIRSISGLSKNYTGKIIFNKNNLKAGDVKERNKLGISHIPEDRHKHGLVLDYDLKENLILRDFQNSRFSKFGFIRFKNVMKHAIGLIDKHDIRSSKGATSSARSMSGGNQQKVIIAREIDRNPKLLIAVQPTRGVDVGAISNIHRQLLEEKKKGTGILLVSYELDEVFALSDRILVMYEGEVVGEFDPRKTNRKELGLYMSGAKKNYKFKEAR